MNHLKTVKIHTLPDALHIMTLLL